MSKWRTWKDAKSALQKSIFHLKDLTSDYTRSKERETVVLSRKSNRGDVCDNRKGGANSVKDERSMKIENKTHKAWRGWDICRWAYGYQKEDIKRKK